MNRTDIIQKINDRSADDGLTILRSERFKKHPLAATSFYTQVARNRYTPFLAPIKAHTIWNHTLIAYETSAIGSVYFLGFYDKDITLFLLKYFKESGDLLDVGSNIGYYTSLFTQIASPTAKIVAFEPTPSTFEVLKINVGRLPQVSLEKNALSDKNGFITFYDYGHRHGVFNSTAAQPLPFLKDKGEKREVETQTLDEWCAKNKAEPSLIKLDTEGTESSIIRTGQTTLKKYQPIILLEVGGGDAWSQNTKECLDMLSGLSYVFFEVNQHGDLTPHIRKDSYTYQNLVCIPEQKPHQYVQPR